jgi:hypothetical protein
MRKLIVVAAAALLGTLGLSACNSNQENGQAESSAEAKVARPTTADVDAAMKACYAKHPEAQRAAAAPAASTSAPASASAPASSAAGDKAPSLDTSGGSNADNPCVRANVEASTWQAYLQQVVTNNMDGISNTPYAYFVPSAKYPENEDSIGRVQGQVNDVVAATVLPGNMIAVGGPDSSTSALVLESAFKQASPGSFKGVVVLFIGDQADEAAVKAAVEPSGATFKFVQM